MGGNQSRTVRSLASSYGIENFVANEFGSVLGGAVALLRTWLLSVCESVATRGVATRGVATI